MSDPALNKYQQILNDAEEFCNTHLVALVTEIVKWHENGSMPDYNITKFAELITILVQGYTGTNAHAIAEGMITKLTYKRFLEQNSSK